MSQITLCFVEQNLLYLSVFFPLKRFISKDFILDQHRVLELDKY